MIVLMTFFINPDSSCTMTFSSIPLPRVCTILILNRNCDAQMSWCLICLPLLSCNLHRLHDSSAKCPRAQTAISYNFWHSSLLNSDDTDDFWRFGIFADVRTSIFALTEPCAHAEEVTSLATREASNQLRFAKLVSKGESYTCSLMLVSKDANGTVVAHIWRCCCFYYTK